MVGDPELDCAGGALLVGTNVWLPDDPRERFISSPDWIGCNRLFCRACRSWVRHLDNVRFSVGASAPPASELESLYLDPHPETYAGFSRDRLPFRVYLCKCECTDMAGVKATPMLDTIDCWKCVGHPAPGAPESVEPPQPNTDAEVATLLRSVQVWDVALRWRPPFVFRSVWPVVTDFLVDANPDLRARALGFVDAWKLGTAVTFDRLLDIAKNHRDLYKTPALRSQLASLLSRKALEFPVFRKTIETAIDGLSE